MPCREQLKTLNVSTSYTYYQPHAQFPFLKPCDTHFIEQTPDWTDTRQKNITRTYTFWWRLLWEGDLDLPIKAEFSAWDSKGVLLNKGASVRGKRRAEIRTIPCPQSRWLRLSFLEDLEVQTSGIFSSSQTCLGHAIQTLLCEQEDVLFFVHLSKLWCMMIWSERWSFPLEQNWGKWGISDPVYPTYNTKHSLNTI